MRNQGTENETERSHLPSFCHSVSLQVRYFVIDHLFLGQIYKLNSDIVCMYRKKYVV
jgi:hypothetical protein